MRLVDRSFLTAILLLAAAPVAGCGDPEIVKPPTGSGASGGTGGTAGSGGIGGNGGEGNVIVGGGGSGTTSTAVDPCDGVACGSDQKCEDQEGTATCVNLTCDEAMCSATEVCDTGPNGGAICKDISCASDVDCPPAQYCDGTICVDDTCAPGVGECSGDDVLVCLPNGSGTALKYTCGSDAYYTSICAGDGMGSATCTCEDDWDCPAFTSATWAAAKARASRPPARCRPSNPSENVLPQPRSPGAAPSAANVNAVGTPPSPAPPNPCNDGRRRQPRRRQRRRPHQRARLPRDPLHHILRHSDLAYTTNGILRAIHGGGVNKGADFFASCGTDPTSGLWSEGDDITDPRLTCTNAAAILDPTAGIAAGDLDNDGIPEIVDANNDDVLIFIDNNRGLIISNTATIGGLVRPTPPPPSSTSTTRASRRSSSVAASSPWPTTTPPTATSSSATASKAPLPTASTPKAQSPASPTSPRRTGLEVIAGSSVYRLPAPPAGATSKIADCAVDGGTITPAPGERDLFLEPRPHHRLGRAHRQRRHHLPRRFLCGRRRVRR